MKIAIQEKPIVELEENPFLSPEEYQPPIKLNPEDNDPKEVIRSRRPLRLALGLTGPPTVAAIIMLLSMFLRDILFRENFSTAGEAITMFIPAVLLFAIIGAIYNCVAIVLYSFIMEFFVRQVKHALFVITMSTFLGFLSGAWMEVELGLCGALTGFIMGGLLWKLDDVKVPVKS